VLALRSSSLLQINYCGNENETLSECPNRFKSVPSCVATAPAGRLTLSVKGYATIEPALTE